MPSYRLTPEEVACVKVLAKLYEGMEPYWHGDIAALGLTEENYVRVLDTMEHIGAISDAVNGERPFVAFAIEQKARQIVREIEAEERQKKETEEKERLERHSVDAIRTAAKRNPFIAWIIIAVGVLGFLLTIAAQATTLLKNLGVI